jgi:simple sugar transport system substrate-binding protein
MFKNLAGGRMAAFLSSLAFLSLGAAPAAAQSTAPLKACFVYVSPIGDAGWTFQHEQGRQAMQQALGKRVVTTAVESVQEGADSERVMRDLAQQDCKLIFATSFGYLEPALRVAAEYPSVVFEHAGGYKTAANLNTYNARFYEGRYLAGLLAGASSKSGIAGYVAGFPVPEVIQGINAFTLGMRAVNPKAEVKVVWLNAWFDPPREREAAQTLMNQGADVLTNHSGSPAVARAAQENHKTRGVHLIAYQSDMRRVAPDAQLSAVVHQWGPYYTEVARSVLEGRWKPQPVWGGMKDGFIAMAPFGPDVSKETATRVRAREADIVAGRFQPFSGKLVDTEGRVRQASGVMDDRALSTMDWFVDGVTGSLPRAARP